MIMFLVKHHTTVQEEIPMVLRHYNKDIPL
jgi:hypothetical protein